MATAAEPLSGLPQAEASQDLARSWKKLTRVTPDRLVRAEVDPDHRLWLDANWTNNSRRTVPDRTAVATWSARVLFWVQQLVAFAGL